MSDNRDNKEPNKTKMEVQAHKIILNISRSYTKYIFTFLLCETLCLNIELLYDT